MVYPHFADIPNSHFPTHPPTHQDANLKRIVSSLYPTLKDACLPTVQPSPDKIRSISWSQISHNLSLTKLERLKSNPNTYIRKDAECMRRYIKLSGAAKGGAEKLGARKGPWTDREDAKVRELVGKYGAKKWSQIAEELPGEFDADALDCMLL